jgi:dolichyl-phosphate beta-glucosyltransferase
MLAARGELRLFLDADGSTPIEDESKLRRVIEMGNADIAIGSRSTGGGCRRFKGPFPGMPGTHPNNGTGGVTWLVKPHRHFMGRFFSLAVNRLMGFSYADTQCGAKMFTPGAAEAIFSRLTTNRFAFDVEVLYLARKLGYRVEEVAVNWQDIGNSSVSLLTDPVAMLFDILKVRHRHRNVTA